MQDLIKPPKPGFENDHIDGNGLNNQEHNLREATHSQNGINKDTRKDNTSGCPGVSWMVNRQKWEVYVHINGKKKHVDFFLTLPEAIKARNEAQLLAHGEFARTISVPNQQEA